MSIVSALDGDDDADNEESAGVVVDEGSNEASFSLAGTIVVGVRTHDSEWERARGPKLSDILLAELEPIWGLYQEDGIF